MKKNLPPLIALRTFEAAARHSSFKRAAEELCVTPSSVSHQIQKLEDWLGVALFERLNRKVLLTGEGRTYFFTLSKAFDEISNVTNLIERRKRDEPMRERLKVIADAGFVECWLGPRLSKFQALAPDVQIEIDFGRDIDDYLKGGADLAIHFGRGEWPEYQSVLLATGIEFPVCHPKLLTGEQALTSPEDLTAFTLLHETDTAGWSNWLKKAGVGHPGNLDGPIFHSTATVFDRVRACEGVALGDDLVATDLLLKGELVKPLGLVRESDYSLYYLQFAAGRGEQVVAVFRDWLIAELADHRSASAILRQNEPYFAA